MADAALATNVAKGEPEFQELPNEGRVRGAIAEAKRIITAESGSREIQRNRGVMHDITADVIKNKPHVSHNSGNNDWFTPATYIAAATKVMGAVDLDPASCAEANEVVGAEKFYSQDDDGLAQDWEGCVWMNPPYAKNLIGQFCEKLVESVELGIDTAPDAPIPEWCW